ncbi:DNA polymerase eta, putative [Candida maltosa Xu316]|uniref:DNA polymerase eta, putative n=1 Tax=Candida maltosa (strain Xu316) TaxID=1245528 RepID=M3K850_CANMX|nr:DNA polymerase eta, putative [Candida maltosa Xu316]
MSVKNSKEPPTTQLHTSPQSPSQFTYQNLHDLNDPATSYLSPLSTIGLVDLNAFFAQVEQIRLGLTDQDPVVCGQWHSLIAVSYAARKYGISRMDTIASAKTKCPNLIIGHAPVYKKGEEYWSYVDGLPNAANHKVSLDMYRRESRKILRVINEKFDLTEKASVDESYIDFGREVFTKLMEYFPELKDVEKDQSLPDIPSELPLGLYWEGEVIKSEQEIADDGEGTEPVIKDWDDVCLVIGSQILLDLRRDIYKELGYTTSAGLARNKLMAKLAGGFKKPDDQTIIRNSSIKAFLKNFELTDITGMGGKLGDSLINQLEVPPQAHTISYIREHFTLEQLKEEIKDDVDLAVKLYHIVRGMYAMELTQRMEVKSMTSTKNFTFDAVANLEDAYGWIKVFSGDLHNRLVDLDNENLELSLTKMETKEKNVIRRPKTLSIGVVFPNRIRQTRQLQIPFYKDLSKMKTIMYENGCVLLREFFEANTNISMVNNNIPCKELYTKDPKKVKVVEMQNMSLTISSIHQPKS